MGVGAVIIIHRKQVHNVQILAVDGGGHNLHQTVIVHVGIAVLLGHKVIFVGDNGVVNPLAGHIGGDHFVNLVGGVSHLIFFQGVFHFKDAVAHQIDIVVVQLPEQVEPGYGLDGPPAVPAGELVQQIRFQLFHIVAGENALRC